MNVNAIKFGCSCQADTSQTFSKIEIINAAIAYVIYRSSLQEIANNCNSLAPVRFSFFWRDSLSFFLWFSLLMMWGFIFLFSVGMHIRSDSFIGHRNIHIIAFQVPKNTKTENTKAKLHVLDVIINGRYSFYSNDYVCSLLLTYSSAASPAHFPGIFILYLNFKLGFFFFNFILVRFLAGWLVDDWLVWLRFFTLFELNFIKLYCIKLNIVVDKNIE